jgi:hypothetical protein
MAHSLFALVAAAAFAFEEYWSNKQPLVDVTRDGSFLSDWDWDDKVPPCSFFNGSYEYTGGLCSHFALARMSSATQIESTDRALACAAHFQTDCILSPEVGLSIPAAFIYDQFAGLKMVIAPKILLLTEHNSTVKRIGFQNPDSRTSITMHFNDTINVQYLRGGTRVMESETMSGSSAYCVQLLRRAFDGQCWREID